MTDLPKLAAETFREMNSPLLLGKTHNVFIDIIQAALEQAAREATEATEAFGLLANPKIREAIKQCVDEWYAKKYKPDSSFSQVHKVYETGCALMGPSVNVEFHDKIVNFAMCGDDVETCEIPNPHKAERDELRAKCERLEASEQKLKEANTPFEDAGSKVEIYQPEGREYYCYRIEGADGGPFKTWREAYRFAEMQLEWREVAKKLRELEATLERVRRLGEEWRAFFMENDGEATNVYFEGCKLGKLEAADELDAALRGGE